MDLSANRLIYNPRYIFILLDITSNFLRNSGNNFFMDDWFALINHRYGLLESIISIVSICKYAIVCASDRETMLLQYRCKTIIPTS